jgi:hypothetical protein
MLSERFFRALRAWHSSKRKPPTEALLTPRQFEELRRWMSPPDGRPLCPLLPATPGTATTPTTARPGRGA